MPDVLAYLSLGSNLGDRLGHLASAVRALVEAGKRPSDGRAPCLTMASVSPVFETAPVGMGGTSAGIEDQPAYLNCAVAIRTHLPPLHLLWLTAGIEAALGRVRQQHWGPRTVDIDIILYGGERVALPDLHIPHPRAHERAFVIKPLLSLDPDLSLAGGGPLSSHLATLPPQDLCEVLSAPDFLRACMG